MNYNDSRYDCCGRIAQNCVDPCGEDFEEWLCDEHYQIWLNHEAK